jgi:diguanylate cyclase (GGDEF)-like protein/PAS domain S-box-containing protein
MTSFPPDRPRLYKPVARARYLMQRAPDWFDALPVPVWIYDAVTLRFVRVNQAAVDRYGYSRAEFAAMTVLDMREPLERELLDIWRNNRARDPARKVEDVGVWRHRRRDGSLLDVHVQLRHTRYGGCAAVLAVLTDVTQVLQGGAPAARMRETPAAGALEVLERQRTAQAVWLQSRALDASSNGLLITNARGRIEYVNAAFTALTGYREAEVLGRHWRLIVRAGKGGASGRAGKIRKLRGVLSTPQQADRVLTLARKDGQARSVQLKLVPIQSGDGVTHHVIVLDDVTELAQSQQSLMRQANYDALTHLPNRNLLQARLQETIAQAQTLPCRFAVMFIDLDHFKDVNDALGHGVGDKLLAQLAARLPACLAAGDTVSRYGGDEFVIVARYEHNAQLHRILDMLVAAVAEPVLIDGHELFVEASIGVSRFPEDGLEADTLLKRADVAMYETKARGRNGYRFYRRELTERIDARLEMSSRLRRALKAQELVLYYQPQVNMMSGAIIGLEALVRWLDPQRGMVLPSVFIPIAEETGLIVNLGEWVLRRACEQGAAWARAGLVVPRISVNVSPLQLQRSDVFGTVQQVLGETGMQANLLELEVTESAIMDNPADASALFTRLRGLGIRIAIDDFGTGYSSLSYLKTFRVDRIKIDRTFVGDIGRDRDDEALTRAIIGLSHSLQCGVIAEGVESALHRQFLLEHGCQDAQGFYYSRAVDAQTIAAMLAGGSVLSAQL